MPAELLTVTEAAARCGVSERTVWTWIRKGLIAPNPEMKGFRRTLLSRDDVEAIRLGREAASDV